MFSQFLIWEVFIFSSMKEIINMSSTTAFKEYKYLRNNKPVVIRRSYEKKGLIELKQQELEEYFKNNAERIKSDKSLRNVFESYNETHQNKISYSMFYQKYVSVFGSRRPQRTSQPIELMNLNNKDEQADKGFTESEPEVVADYLN